MILGSLTVATGHIPVCTQTAWRKRLCQSSLWHQCLKSLSSLQNHWLSAALRSFSSWLRLIFFHDKSAPDEIMSLQKLSANKRPTDSAGPLRSRRQDLTGKHEQVPELLRPLVLKLPCFLLMAMVFYPQYPPFRCRTCRAVSKTRSRARPSINRFMVSVPFKLIRYKAYYNPSTSTAQLSAPQSLRRLSALLK